jgi:hypothetical protein
MMLFAIVLQHQPEFSYFQLLALFMGVAFCEAMSEITGHLDRSFIFCMLNYRLVGHE